MLVDLSWYFGKNLLFEVNDWNGDGKVITDKNITIGRKVISSELDEINAFTSSSNTKNKSVTMYYHFYGVSGDEHRVLPSNMFSSLGLSKEKLYESGINRWRMDMTVYNAGVLGKNELNRSKGHVNKRSVELFQVLEGEVRIYIERQTENCADGYYVDLKRGDICYVPAGWYHSTHVIKGPAIVVDIVNREGFVDWRYKGYKDRQSCCTFLLNENKFIPMINDRLIEQKQLIYRLEEGKRNNVEIQKKYANSLLGLMTKSSDKELELFAKRTLIKMPKKLPHC